MLLQYDRQGSYASQKCVRSIMTTCPHMHTRTNGEVVTTRVPISPNTGFRIPTSYHLSSSSLKGRQCIFRRSDLLNRLTVPLLTATDKIVYEVSNTAEEVTSNELPSSEYDDGVMSNELASYELASDEYDDGVTSYELLSSEYTSERVRDVGWGMLLCHQHLGGPTS